MHFLSYEAKQVPQIHYKLITLYRKTFSYIFRLGSVTVSYLRQSGCDDLSLILTKLL